MLWHGESKVAIGGDPAPACCAGDDFARGAGSFGTVGASPFDAEALDGRGLTDDLAL